MDCSPPTSSVHGILQARILEWVAISFSRGSSWPRDLTRVSCTTGRLFTIWATREAQRRLSAKQLMLSNKGTGEDSWESLDFKKSKPVNLKGNQSWIVIGRTDAEAEAPILWPPDAKSRLIGKDLDAGKDWCQKEKMTAGHEMVGWHHQPNAHEFVQTPGDREGQGSLACCSPWRLKESEMI